MVVYLVDRYDHGCWGRKFKNDLEAIRFGCYMPWNRRRIRLAFNFSNGTIRDLRRFAKGNNSKIMSEDKFMALLRQLPVEEQQTHIEFINEMCTMF